VTIAILIQLLSICPSVQASPAELPVPREETVIFEGDHEYTVFDSFNPFIPNGAQWYAGWQQVVMEWDWYINLITGENIMWRITGWEYADNNTKFTIHVRPGVLWSDGVPYTANDIVFTYNMLKQYPELFGATVANEAVESVTAPDDLTAVFTLKKSDPRFHYRFRFWGPGTYIVPEHIWKDTDPRTFKNNPPVTTGPYVLNRTIPELFMFIWIRNENYWAKALGYFPKPKYMVWRSAPPIDKDFTDLVSGLTDAPPRTFTWPMIQQAKAVNPNIAWGTYLDICSCSLSINCERYPLSLPEVRQAISYAIDRKKYEDPTWWFASNGTIACKYMFAQVGTLDKWTTYPELSKHIFEYNLTKANELLDNLGFARGGDGIRVTPNGTRLSFDFVTLVPTQVTHPMSIIEPDIARGLMEIGIDTNIIYWSTAVGEEITFGKHDIWDSCSPCCDTAFTGDLFYNFMDFQGKYYTPIGERPPVDMANTRWHDPELDAYMDQLALMSPDDPDALPIYLKAYEIQAEGLPYIPTVEPVYSMVYSTQYWTGWPTDENMYQVPYDWWPTTLFIVLNLLPSGAPPPVKTVTTTVRETVTQTTTVTQAAETVTETVTVPTMDVTSVAGAGVVALVVGVAVGWLVASRKRS